jgi:hypothetical protein
MNEESKNEKYEFLIGQVVWDKGNKTYGVVLNNFGDPENGDRGEIRLDSDGMQSIKNYADTKYNLVPIGSKEDKGNGNLEELKESAKRLIGRAEDAELKDYYKKAYKRVLAGEFDKFKKMESGGEVYVPVQMLANNPDALVNTTTMSELFAKGGDVQRMGDGGYIAIYGGKSMMIDGTSLYDAFKKAMDAFKVPKSKQGLLSVHPNKPLDTSMFAMGGKLYASDEAYRVDVVVDEDVKETLIIRGRNKGEVRMMIEDMYEDKMENKYGEDVMFEIIETKGDGGKIGFEALSKKVAARYVGEKVKPQYQDEYGKTYSKEEADEVGDKVAAKVYRQQQGMMAKGGAMEHMIMEGDIVKAVYKNMLIIESRNGVIDIVDLDSEPFARRIVVELITGENSVESAKEEIDRTIAYESNKMAKGLVFYEGQSVMFPLTKNTRLDRSVKNLFNQYANKELVIGKITSDEPYDEAEAFLKSTGEKVPFTLTLNPKYLFPYKESGVMSEGGRLEAQSLEMAQNVSVQIAHHAEELKDALNGKTYVEPWVTSMLQRAADNLSDATHYLEGKDDKMADGGMMSKGGKIREFDDVLIISKNRLGMVEAIADNIYYVTTPFGETFKATIDDLKKIISFDKGGDVKIGEIAMIAKENKATGEEVAKKISKGADVEMEHTEDRKFAIRIAVDHLKEDFNYYEKLRKAGL